MLEIINVYSTYNERKNKIERVIRINEGISANRILKLQLTTQYNIHTSKNINTEVRILYKTKEPKIIKIPIKDQNTISDEIQSWLKAIQEKRVEGKFICLDTIPNERRHYAN